MEKYILDKNGKPVLEPDVLKWAANFEKYDRKVALTHVGKSDISTVFLGLDHAFGGRVPVLWETMVFGGKLDGEQDRCSGLRSDAQMMHNRMVKKVKQAR